MSPITLSYVTSTKNKLPYLKDRLSLLIAQKQGDEEILVADGASTDGTVEYLEELKRAGKIDYFVSEPDYGESEALNKLFLAAKGSFITLVTDDDVFDYYVVRACKAFMLAHPSADIISTNGGFFGRTEEPLEQDALQLVRALEYEKDYIEWQHTHRPFNFCGLGIIFRRSSLPVLGLWNLSFRAADAEFSFRTTAGKANVAWYTGYSFVNVSNPQSVSIVYREKIKSELERLNKFYLDKNPEPYILQKIKALITKVKMGSSKRSEGAFVARWPQIAAVAEKWLEIKNEKEGKFLYKE